ncbi:hypothetical protein N7E02_19685 [Aliirhizobium terrae]|uniref:hypothetical protein n=1 Tax=Terrirhizobium terrae TaxID=2926709 RepID=UPI0025779F04|nr:hypothetical protein [Rhizobium sp. CC-CFT758]WJH39104.1 hypothetical protein N7E02_19685 [Rhizobium sp. CC-CFT758]
MRISKVESTTFAKNTVVVQPMAADRRDAPASIRFGWKNLALEDEWHEFMAHRKAPPFLRDVGKVQGDREYHPDD